MLWLSRTDKCSLYFVLQDSQATSSELCVTDLGNFVKKKKKSTCNCFDSTTLLLIVKPDKSVLTAVCVTVMWEVWLFNLIILLLCLSSRVFHFGVVFSFHVFWLRSYGKTGVGCDNSTRPLADWKFHSSPPSPVLRLEYCLTVKHYENVDEAFCVPFAGVNRSPM